MRMGHYRNIFTSRFAKQETMLDIKFDQTTHHERWLSFTN